MLAWHAACSLLQARTTLTDVTAASLQAGYGHLVRKNASSPAQRSKLRVALWESSTAESRTLRLLCVWGIKHATLNTWKCQVGPQVESRRAHVQPSLVLGCAGSYRREGPRAVERANTFGGSGCCMTPEQKLQDAMVLIRTKGVPVQARFFLESVRVMHRCIVAAFFHHLSPAG